MMMCALNIALPAEPGRRTLAERRAVGRSLRERVPRSSHAEWSPAADRPDPISLLQEQDSSRLAQFVPLRYERMIASPFAFLRGSAVVMAGDLAATPVTGLQVQICGDAHLSNFGVYATPERNQVFDVNDFDETLPGPWEWDVKRLAASLEVAARERGFSGKERVGVVMAAVGGYRAAMREFAEMNHLAVWYTRADVEQLRAELEPRLTKNQLKSWDKGEAKARTSN